MRRKVLHLVDPVPSKDTVQCIMEMLEAAKLGQLVGFAGTCLHKDGEYTVQIRGEARRRPTVTYGMIAMVNAELRKLMKRSRSQSSS